jgi:hypothetical protein
LGLIASCQLLFPSPPPSWPVTSALTVSNQASCSDHRSTMPAAPLSIPSEQGHAHAQHGRKSSRARRGQVPHALTLKDYSDHTGPNGRRLLATWGATCVRDGPCLPPLTASSSLPQPPSLVGRTAPSPGLLVPAAPRRRLDHLADLEPLCVAPRPRLALCVSRRDSRPQRPSHVFCPPAPLAR